VSFYNLSFRIAAVSILAAVIAPGQQPPTPSTTPPSPPPSSGSEGETGNYGPLWSFELFYWLPHTQPKLRGGAAAPDYESLDFLGSSNGSPGVMFSFPINKNDTIQISGFQTNGRGSSTATQALDLFGTAVPQGDYVTTHYKIRAAKASFQDLLYPFPRDNAKLRFMTLWEGQFVQISSRTDAPLDTTTDSSDGFTSYPSAIGNRWVFLPTLGLALQYAATNHFSLELKGSGFGIPHHTDIVDSEGSAAYQIGPVAVVVGGRFFDFKTSPRNAEYYRAALSGAYVGLRWTAR
jgi:hypothetical protein